MEELDNALDYIPRYLRVLTKADERGESQLVPMNLFPCQKHYIENRTNRDIILKPRQMGLSTGIMGVNAHRVFTIPYSRMSIVTHRYDVSEMLFQTVHRFLKHLPDDMKPETDWQAGHRIRFPKLDSLIHIDSAESSAIGYGETLNIAHLSEMSRWPESKAYDLFAGISQTVPLTGFITIESNPRGRGGLFYSLYNDATKGKNNYKPFFYPWWWETGYKMAIKGQLQYTKEEQLLVEKEHLTPEQIQWRREKISELGDLFYQEYCENDVDCWLSSEVSVFDGAAIRRYLLQTQPGRIDGHLTIWKDVIGGEKYVIGVDTAGGSEKGDYLVASVIRVRTNEYVARLRARIALDLFAQELLRLGQKYNMAQIGVERIMHGHTVLRILMENNYPDIYHHQDYDAFLGNITSQPGWNTSGKTKPIMIDTLSAALRAGDIIIWSENFCLEASSYMWEGQKTRKGAGAFDDELDAVMIALQLREQIPIFETKRSGPRSYAKI